MTLQQNGSIPQFQAVVDECLPLLKALARGRYAVSIGGSLGKGVSDKRSDIDFRLFCDEIVGGPEFWQADEWEPFSQAVARWRAQGIEIDYCWIRTIDEVNTQLEAWLSGQVQPVDKVWTL